MLLVSLLKYMSELMLLLPWNLLRLASLSLALSEPKNMSELIDLALPNLLTASAPAGPEDMGDAAFLGLQIMHSC